MTFRLSSKLRPNPVPATTPSPRPYQVFFRYRSLQSNLNRCWETASGVLPGSCHLGSYGRLLRTVAYAPLERRDRPPVSAFGRCWIDVAPGMEVGLVAQRSRLDTAAAVDAVEVVETSRLARVAGVPAEYSGSISEIPPLAVDWNSGECLVMDCPPRGCLRTCWRLCCSSSGAGFAELCQLFRQSI